MNILELPEDILIIVFSFLEPQDLISACRSCRALYRNDNLLHSIVYWRDLTQTTFRDLSYPLDQNDGKRWMKLYHRLANQSKIYTWGNNDHGSLMGSQIRTRHLFHRHGMGTFPPLVLPTLYPQTMHWPKQAPEECVEDMGNISDVQCGGWSTVLLNSKGRLFVNGIINGEQFLQMPSLKPCELGFPNNYARRDYKNNLLYDSVTALSQFSAGRTHILGLSDSGRVWSWDNHHSPGVGIRFLGIDQRESEYGVPRTAKGCVRRVQAGWSRSSALVVGAGIVVWEPVENDAVRIRERNQNETDPTRISDEIDTALVADHRIVPHTGYFEGYSGHRFQKDDVNAKDYGEVRNWVLLESFVIFVTSNGRVFASSISDKDQDDETRLLELTSPSSEPEGLVADIAGNFRSFAALKRNGEVYVGGVDYIEARWHLAFENSSSSNTLPHLRRFPSLQHTGVISVVFGDYHFHALHSNGTITSYGRDSQFCGSLGLGGLGIDFMRGMAAGAPNAATIHPDGELLPECHTTGRRIHFEEDKLSWLHHIRASHVNRQEAVERVRLCASNLTMRAEISEWVEKRLNSWEDAVLIDDEEGKMEPSHFAVCIAASGWHSAAIVLVDEDKSSRVKEMHRIPRSAAEMRKERQKRDAEARQRRTRPQPGPRSPSDPSNGRQRDVIMIVLWYLWRNIVNLVRWFLGLPLLGRATGFKSSKAEWIWEKETFPRLRMRNGDVLPGNVPIMDSQAPPWQPITEVDL